MCDSIPVVNDFLYYFKYLLQVEKLLFKTNCSSTITMEKFQSAFKHCTFLLT